MSIRTAARRAALAIPPLRRLYEFAQQQALENARLVDALRQAETSGSTYNDLQAKLLAAESEREGLELQLYVLNSDHRRASTRNEALAALLREATQREQYIRDTRTDQCSQVASLFDLQYEKLSSRMALLSSEIAMLRPSTANNEMGTRLYLDLLENALAGTLFMCETTAPWAQRYDPKLRSVALDWPKRTYTTVGSAHLRNFRILIERFLSEGVPGDLIEVGVSRGGFCILMRGVLAAYGVTDRTVWVADSFASLPAPEGTYPTDSSEGQSTVDELRVSLDNIKEYLEHYRLLDQQVRFLKGRSKEILRTAPIERLAILRLDGDMYSSTIQTLDVLYEKVSPGGFVVVDDYILAGCRQAVDDYRQQHNIYEPLQDIDGTAVFWRKSG